MKAEATAEKVARMLAERGLTLGTVEIGKDGIVSYRVFDAPDGPTVLGNSLVVDNVEEAIGLMNLPRPQFKKAGDLSAKAARAAAREGRAFLGVDLCLVVWARATLASEQPVHVALATSQEVIVQTFRGEEQGRQATDWLVDKALDVVWRALS